MPRPEPSALPTSPASLNVRRLGIVLLVCGSYLVGALAGFVMPELDARFHVTLLPFGIAVGALHRFGWRWWPAVLACTAVAPLAAGVALPDVLLTATIVLAGVFAAAAALRRLRVLADCGKPDAVAGILVAATAGAAVVSTLFVAIATLRGQIELGQVFEWWLRWSVGAFLSTVLSTPFVLLARREQWTLRRASAGELAAWLAISLALLVAALQLPPNYLGLPIFGGAMLLALWAVVRMNVLLALASGTAFTIVALLSSTMGVGLLASYPPHAALRLVWNAGLLYGAGMLALNAFLVMHERADRRYRALFDGSPEPVWLVDPVDGRFLAVNDAAVRTYGWSAEEFAGMTVHDVVVRPAHSGADAETAVLELHRRRDGSLLRVEPRSNLLALDDRTARLTFNIDVTEREIARERALLAGARERQRLGREIHDGLGQELTGAAFVLDALAARARRGEAISAQQLDDGTAFVRAAFETARRIAHGLAPLRDGIGLDTALHELVARVRMPANRTIDLQVDAGAHGLDLPKHVVEGLYRIAQEAVSNAMRHSGARTIVVGLESTDVATVLHIRDDGVGFDTAGTGARGLGLRSLRERAAEIGVSLRVDSATGSGTSIECEYLSVTAGAPAAQTALRVAEVRALEAKALPEPVPAGGVAAPLAAPAPGVATPLPARPV